MFVISGEGHFGFWWEGDKPVFTEKCAGIFPSRADCLEYLEKIHGRDRAIEIIMLLKNNKGKSYSF